MKSLKLLVIKIRNQLYNNYTYLSKKSLINYYKKYAFDIVRKIAIGYDTISMFIIIYF